MFSFVVLTLSFSLCYFAYCLISLTNCRATPLYWVMDNRPISFGTIFAMKNVFPDFIVIATAGLNLLSVFNSAQDGSPVAEEYSFDCCSKNSQPGICAPNFSNTVIKLLESLCFHTISTSIYVIILFCRTTETTGRQKAQLFDCPVD